MELGLAVQATDDPIVFTLPFTGNYEAIDFFNGSTLMSPGSLTDPNNPAPSTLTGANQWDNNTKIANVALTSKAGASKTMVAKTIVCRENKAEWC
jgi:hypothetical protein